jgi:hypothetical protein
MSNPGGDKMRRLALAALAAGLGALLLPAVALAKGASEATIVGPGLDDPITLAGEGSAGGQELMYLAEAAGFFPAVFVRIPDPMLDEQPEGELGPRYTITYTMPGPKGEDRIVQQLYPFAKPSAVTYVAPGQSFFGTEKTRGGWFVAGPTMNDHLFAAGLPREAPVVDRGDRFPWTVVSAIAALAVAVALAVGGILALRQRARTATAQAK